ncbi:MAG: TetR/AcrR family transcriptional regulator [Candidatus Thiodiazotropha sp. (ex Dulcina madagascariensis)]|nr:TetR/AcrR family transcriptional regulator [Candidatus Thiodiazotropha sp. (ex Dulcina madagascariensis)]
MPCPKDRKEKSRDLILNAAVDLFSRYGFDRVSIGQIMKMAKMTHGAFYAHFESKEALYRASFLETLKKSRAARLVKGPLSIKHLTSLVTNYWNLSELEKKDKPGSETILFNEIGNNNSSIKRLFEESYDNLKKMIEIRIAALIKLKQLPFESDREMIAEKSRAILASLVGAVAVAKNLSREDERRQILESTQKQILNMLGVKESELVANGIDENKL